MLLPSTPKIGGATIKKGGAMTMTTAGVRRRRCRCATTASSSHQFIDNQYSIISTVSSYRRLRRHRSEWENDDIHSPGHYIEQQFFTIARPLFVDIQVAVAKHSTLYSHTINSGNTIISQQSSTSLPQIPTK